MSQTNSELTRDFLAHFQSARSDLTTRLDGLKSTGATSDGLERLSQDVTKLRRELTEATSFLPSYDQRQCELRLKETEDTLESLRASAAPKPKFSFKRKASAAPTVTAARKPSEHVPVLASTGTDPALSNSALLHSRSHSFLTWASLKNRPSTSASDLSIADVDHCVVTLLPSDAAKTGGAKSFGITALHVRNVRDSVLILPQIEGSALLHDVIRSVIVLGCHQYRMHTSSSVDVYLHVSSDPIIEHCSAIRFAGYPSSFRGTVDALPESKHQSVKDFSHIRASPSPNWSFLPEEQAITESAWPVDPEPSGSSVDEVLSRLLSPAA